MVVLDAWRAVRDVICVLGVRYVTSYARVRAARYQQWRRCSLQLAVFVIVAIASERIENVSPVGA
jgi:hypothetical protein